MTTLAAAIVAAVCALLPESASGQSHDSNLGQAATKLTYPIVDTQVGADVVRNPPSYQNNGDDTVSDLVTGLMWTQPSAEKMSYADAVAGAKKC